MESPTLTECRTALGTFNLYSRLKSFSLENHNDTNFILSWASFSVGEYEKPLLCYFNTDF